MKFNQEAKIVQDKERGKLKCFSKIGNQEIVVYGNNKKEVKKKFREKAESKGNNGYFKFVDYT